MSASFVQGTGGPTPSGGQASIAASLTGVTAGDLIVISVHWGQSGDTSTISSVSDGTTNASSFVEVSNSNGEHAQLFYYLAGKGGNVTYTATFSGSGQFPRMTVMQFHSSVSGTWSADGHNGAGATSSSSVNTGNITTTGTVEVAVLLSKLYDVGASASNAKINGNAVTTFTSNIDSFYQLPTSPFTNGAGTLTYSTPTNWVALIGAFSFTTSVTPTGVQVVIMQ